MKKMILIVLALCGIVHGESILGGSGNLYGGAGVSGATGSSGSDFIVAASDSSQSWKDRADYVCDGTADNVQINEAIDASSGSVLLAPGNYLIDGSIYPADNIELKGSGIGNTFLNGSSTLTVSVIERSSAPTTPIAKRTSESSPSIGWSLRDLTISGELMPVGGDGTYTYADPPLTDGTDRTGGKGIFANFLQDVIFENVKVVRSPKTGFGNDSHINCKYVDCIANDCGWSRYVYSGTYSDEYVGCYGFGIGVCGIENESVVLVDCYANNNRQAGFGFETTGQLGSLRPTKLEMRGCIAEENIGEGFKVLDLSNGLFNASLFECTANHNGGDGISVYTRARHTSIVDCDVFSNTLNGIRYGDGDNQFAGKDPQDCLISNCRVWNNSEHGIWVNGRECNISDSKIYGNVKYGVYVNVFASSGYDVQKPTIVDNEIFDNGIGSSTYSGIYLAGNATYDIDQAVIKDNRCYDRGALVHSISSISRTDNVVTAICSRDHGFLVGESVTTAGITDAGFDGTFIVIEATNYDLTWAQVDANASSSGGTVTRNPSQQYGLVIDDYITNATIQGNVLSDNVVGYALIGNTNGSYFVPPYIDIRGQVEDGRRTAGSSARNGINSFTFDDSADESVQINYITPYGVELQSPDLITRNYNGVTQAGSKVVRWSVTWGSVGGSGTIPASDFVVDEVTLQADQPEFTMSESVNSLSSITPAAGDTIGISFKRDADHVNDTVVGDMDVTDLILRFKKY